MGDLRLFRSVYNTHLAHQNGYVVAVPYLDQTCHFHLEHHYDRVALRTNHGQFVGVNHVHQVFLTNGQESHKFFLERFGDGRVALKSMHNTYLCVEPNGSVRAHHVLEAGVFFVEERPAGAVIASAPAVAYAQPPQQVVYQQPPPQQVVYQQPPQQQVVYQQPPQQQVVYQQPPPVVVAAPPQVVYAAPPPTVIVAQRGPSVGVGLGVGLALGLGLGHRHHGHHHHGHRR